MVLCVGGKVSGGVPTAYSCRSIYIGEIKKALEACIKEHKSATKLGETPKSAIVEHFWSQHHLIHGEETSVLY